MCVCAEPPPGCLCASECTVVRQPRRVNAMWVSRCIAQRESVPRPTGGQVLLSDATRVLVEDDLPTEVFLRDLGLWRLKDVIGRNGSRR